MWLGVIHYVVNQHKWILPHRLGTKSPCIHGPLTEERETGRLETLPVYKKRIAAI